MANKKAGGIFVDIIATQWDAFKSKVLGLKAGTEEADKALAKFSRTADLVGGKLRNAFLAGAGAVTAFLAAADQGGLSVLALKAEFAARAIGNIFLPLVQTVGQALDTIKDFFNGLTSEQKTAILLFAEISLGALAVGWAVAKLLVVTEALIPVLAAVAGWFAAIDALTGWGTVLFVVGALVLAFEGLKDVLGSVWGLLKAVAGLVMVVIRPLVAALTLVFDVISGIIQFVADKIAWVIDKATALINGFVSLIRKIPGVGKFLAGDDKPGGTAGAGPVQRQFANVSDMFKQLNTAKSDDLVDINKQQLNVLKSIEDKIGRPADGRVRLA